MNQNAEMDLELKISLCSGADAWHTKAIPTAGIPALCMSDGPHGLRKTRQDAELTGIHDSEPATCFPTAALTACSWDTELLEELGGAIAEEAAAHGVGLLLGPGANIKRNPLCGRNFEYFSEDPELSGKLAAAYIRGVESRGVGACVKHFAANSQEYKRFNSDSVMDERTLREIYLRAFEIAVKEGKPSAVMCAYNKLNGEHCSDSRKLLTEILREDWGFDGMVVTDWGAMNDRRLAFEAGCDLCMPGGSAYQERETAEAVRRGELDGRFIDASAERVERLARRAQSVQKARVPFDAQAHHALARRAAAESAVLLKNKGGLLPLDENLDLLFVGPMVKSLRIQGAGSSHVNPLRLPQLAELFPDIPAVEGCRIDGGRDAKLLKEAEKAAKKAGVAVVFAGLPDSYESEGFDRASMAMPEGYLELIDTVAAVNPHTVVVLLCGAPVEMPWADKVKSILYLGLPGQAGAEAAGDLIFGRACPSGKLAESWPLRYADCVSAPYYSGTHKDAHYREGLYVGYRYYQKAGVPVRYPFGFGLSYTRFAYSALRVDESGVSFRVTNKGKCDGAEIAQLYIEPVDAGTYRAKRELKGFQKVFLKRGETKTLRFALDERSFALWENGWIVPGGSYRVLVGGCSEDFPLAAELCVDGKNWDGGRAPAWYARPTGCPSHVDFERLIGRPAAEERVRKGTFTMDNTVLELKEESLLMKLAYWIMQRSLAKSAGDKNSPEYRMALSTAADAPLRSLKMFLGKDTDLPEALLALLNGRGRESLALLLSRDREKH